MSDEIRGAEADAPALATPGVHPLRLLNRERSMLQFNRRVLAQARREVVPLLERLRYVRLV
jgi:polyphosphate kinase